MIGGRYVIMFIIFIVFIVAWLIYQVHWYQARWQPHCVDNTKTYSRTKPWKPRLNVSCDKQRRNNMTLLEKLCKEIGVKTGEEWLANDGKTYMIDNKIVEWYEPTEVDSMDYESWVFSDDNVYKKLLLGELKPIWTPKKEDEVYTICFLEDDYVYDFLWKGGTPWEQEMIESGLVFETKEEAIETANKMLTMLKEDK